MGMLGRIVEIWRYPVTSLGGEQLAAAQLAADGLAQDRRYALVDAAGVIAAPEREARWRRALALQASLPGATPVITFPDGRRLALDDPAMREALTAFFGFAVAIAVCDPAVAGDGLPTVARRDAHAPLHLLTTASLRRLQALGPGGLPDRRRFRPTVLVETAGADFVEDGWIGRRLRLGDAELAAQDRATRCGMTILAQPGIAEEPEILRQLVRHNRRHFGIYCGIARAGAIAVGDSLALLD
jgi:uncharacterized protein YcbX